MKPKRDRLWVFVLVLVLVVVLGNLSLAALWSLATPMPGQPLETPSDHIQVALLWAILFTIFGKVLLDDV